MTDMAKLKILIAVPSMSHWLADFGTSLVSLVGYLAMNKVKGYGEVEFRVMNIKGSILPKSRLAALKAAKDTGCSHLLFIDSDHTFPPNLAHQLLSREKDVVAANCVTKTIPAMTTARLRGADKHGEVVFSDPEFDGLQRVWRVGTGVLLLSRKAFMQIPHSAFAMPYKEDEDTYQGEDWTMCEAMDALGIPIYVDHKASLQIGHVGQFNYTHDVVGQVVRKEAA